MRRALILILFLFFSGIANAAIYIVNPSAGGSNANSGLPGAPWATIQHAASTAIAGDTVYVKEGTYSEQVTFPYSGTSLAYITFIAQGSVLVKGTAAVTLWTGIFNINTKSYLRIKGFFVQDSYWFGIYVENSHHIYLEDDSTYNTGASGISVWNSNHVYASNNVVRKACYQSLSTGSQESITFSNVTDFEIHHNEVYESGGSNNGGEGIDTKEACMNGKVYNNTVHDLVRLGIYADCWDKTLQNVEIFNNRVYNCGEGVVLSSENGGTLKEVKVYNNLTYNNINFGITVSDYGTNGPRANISIMNNTVYNNGYGDSNTGWGGGIILGTTNVSNIEIFNNIVSANDAMQLSDNSGVASVSIHHNLIFGYRGHNWTGEIKGTNYIEADPMFVAAAGVDQIQGNKDDDLRVANGSSAINAGVLLNAPAFDFNNNIRPAEGITDLGAYEYNSIPLFTRKPDDSRTLLSLEVYPNPSQGSIVVKLLTEITWIQVINNRGAVLSEFESLHTGELLKISLPAPGLYMLRLSGDHGQEVYKVVNVE